MTPELALERRAQRLAGRRVARVWYHDARALGPVVHEVAVAVHLELDDGRRVRIGTSRELATRHGSGVCLGEQHTLPPGVREVTGTPPWASDPITAARVHWRAIEDALRASLRTGLAIGIDHLTRHDFPQALELVWANSLLFVAAARLTSPTTAEGLASSLLVIAGTAALDGLQLR
jgi:hypothetical protein